MSEVELLQRRHLRQAGRDVTQLVAAAVQHLHVCKPTTYCGKHPGKAACPFPFRHPLTNLGNLSVCASALFDLRRVPISMDGSSSKVIWTQ